MTPSLESHACDSDQVIEFIDIWSEPVTQC